MTDEAQIADKTRLAAVGIAGSPHIIRPFAFEPPISLHGVSVLSHVRIGRHSYMNNGMIRQRVSIGRYCSIGRNVVIAAGGHAVDALTRLVHYENSSTNDPRRFLEQYYEQQNSI